MTAMIQERLNVAIMGGSFNPPHIGHIRTMEAVLDQCTFINQIWMVPTISIYGVKDLVGFTHRYIMCKAATEGMPYIHVSDYEEQYQITSTWALMTTLSMDVRYQHITFYFIIGTDCLMNIDSWVNSALLIKSVPFIIVPRKRAGYTDRIPTKASWVYEEKNTFIKSKKGDKHITPDISSTKIRNAFSAKMVQPLGIWLHPNVMAYCEHYKLYSHSPEPKKNLTT